MAFDGIKKKLGKDFYTPVVEAKILAVSKIADTLIGRALEYDVNIAFGTDAGVYPHGENAGEFALMVCQFIRYIGRNIVHASISYELIR